MTLFHTLPPRELDLILLNHEKIPWLSSPTQSLEAGSLCAGRLASNIPGLEEMGQPGAAARGEQPPRDARGETAAALRPKVNSKDGR